MQQGIMTTPFVPDDAPIATAPARPQRLSEMLQNLADDPALERVSVSDMLETMRARLKVLAWPVSQRVLGGLCLIVSIALALPVPFANMAPAIALCLIGLGVLERDGVWIIIGILAALASLVYVAGLGYALVKSAIFVILNAF